MVSFLVVYNENEQKRITFHYVSSTCFQKSLKKTPFFSVFYSYSFVLEVFLNESIIFCTVFSDKAFIVKFRFLSNGIFLIRPFFISLHKNIEKRLIFVIKCLLNKRLYYNAVNEYIQDDLPENA